MERRTFIATTGAALGAALGGCLAESDDSADPGADGSPTETETNTPTDVPEVDTQGPGSDSPTPGPSPGGPTDRPPVDGVVVDDIAVRNAVAYESVMGSGGVLADPERQYVVATVRSDADLSASAFVFEADGQSWEPGLPETTGATNYAVAGHEGGPVGRPVGSDRSYLAFSVPASLPADDPRIRYTGDADSGGDGATAEPSGGLSWPLPDAAREGLTDAVATFDLVDLSVPDSISAGDPLSVSVTVENTSETDGRFLAACYWPTELIADDDESTLLEREVTAGERTEFSVEFDTEYTAFESGPVTLRVAGHVAAEREVEVTDVETPS